MPRTWIMWTYIYEILIQGGLFPTKVIQAGLSWELSPHKICPGMQEKICTPLCETNGEGNGTPLQYSCLENPMDGGA